MRLKSYLNLQQNVTLGKFSRVLATLCKKPCASVRRSMYKRRKPLQNLILLSPPSNNQFAHLRKKTCAPAPKICAPVHPDCAPPPAPKYAPPNLRMQRISRILRSPSPFAPTHPSG